ncbi:urokinase plasminogen activator surface receptor-like [Protopterus annectens]|uniref:urokinase plasminogen activator surface receptor-like n=1 Tax=Protopterus annectens TaxID=7888 RepID=UPI001CFB279E|nr:urokinase plasminogen activator surface receptor-like [Protopterus annectens]
MKIIWVVLYMGTLLYVAASLECYECSGNSTTCPEVRRTCGPAEDVCITVSQRSIYTGRAKVELLTKSCSSSVSCIGNMSFTAASLSYSAITNCCKTNLCNDGKFFLPDSTAPNGLTCTSCYGGTLGDCDGNDKPTINCTGPDNQCINIDIKWESIGLFTAKGCGSLPFCNDIIGIQQITGLVGCCNTNNCNNATTTIIPTIKNNQKCYSCLKIDNSACNPIQAACYGSMTKCGDISTKVTANGFPLDIFATGCISPPLCHLQSALATVGLDSTTQFECCNGNLCNVKNFIFPTSPPTTTRNAVSTTIKTSNALTIVIFLSVVFIT